MILWPSVSDILFTTYHIIELCLTGFEPVLLLNLLHRLLDFPHHRLQRGHHPLQGRG